MKAANILHATHNRHGYMHMPPPKNLTICLKIKKILTLAARLPASIGQNKPRTAGAFLVLRQFFRMVTNKHECS